MTTLTNDDKKELREAHAGFFLRDLESVQRWQKIWDKASRAGCTFSGTVGEFHMSQVHDEKGNVIVGKRILTDDVDHDRKEETPSKQTLTPKPTQPKPIDKSES